MGEDHDYSDGSDYSGQSSRYDYDDHQNDYDHQDDYDDHSEKHSRRSHRRKRRGRKDCGAKNTVNEATAFVIWLIVLIVLIWVLRAAGIRWFSAVGFSLLIAAIVLCMVFPCHFEFGRFDFSHQKNALFAFILFITFIIVVVWIFYKVFTDRPEWYRMFCQKKGFCSDEPMESHGGSWLWGSGGWGNGGKPMGPGMGKPMSNPGTPY